MPKAGLNFLAKMSTVLSGFSYLEDPLPREQQQWRDGGARNRPRPSISSTIHFLGAHTEPRSHKGGGEGRRNGCPFSLPFPEGPME